MSLIAYPAWVFLIAGGAMSAFTISPGWDRAVAYLVALGLLLLAADCILKHIRHSRLITRR